MVKYCENVIKLKKYNYMNMKPLNIYFCNEVRYGYIPTTRSDKI